MFKTMLVRPKIQQKKPWLTLQQPDITPSSPSNRPVITKGSGEAQPTAGPRCWKTFGSDSGPEVSEASLMWMHSKCEQLCRPPRQQTSQGFSYCLLTQHPKCHRSPTVHRTIMIQNGTRKFPSHASTLPSNQMTCPQHNLLLLLID